MHPDRYGLYDHIAALHEVIRISSPSTFVPGSFDGACPYYGNDGGLPELQEFGKEGFDI